MGMFDDILVAPELMPKEFGNRSYVIKGQTKDFSCRLDTLTICMDGTVFLCERGNNKNFTIQPTVPEEEWPEHGYVEMIMNEGTNDYRTFIAKFRNGRIVGRFKPTYDYWNPHWKRPYRWLVAKYRYYWHRIERCFWPERVAERKRKRYARIEARVRAEFIVEHPLLKQLEIKGKELYDDRQSNHRS